MFDTLLKNPLLVAGMGLGGAGIVTYLLKDVPLKIWSLIRRELTTELTLTSNNLSFHELLIYIQKEYSNKNFRKLKVTNGRWGSDDNVISLGYGYHKIKYKNKNFFINLIKEQNDRSDTVKEIMTITTLGRKKEIFINFIEEISKKIQDDSKIKIYKYDNGWCYIKELVKRDIKSVYLPKKTKETLLNKINYFRQKEGWYLKNGIPYQLGILLHGSPGTGKTSIIKALASEFDYPIYYITPSNLSSFETAASTLPDKCLLIIEDIDSASITHERADNKNTFTDNLNSDNMLKEFSHLGLSDLLNAIDGFFSSHGRILIASTNHIDKLDSALIRPGRIDLKIEIGYITSEILQEFLCNFYPTYKNYEYKIKNNVTVAQLQGWMLEGLTADEIVEKCCK